MIVIFFLTHTQKKHASNHSQYIVPDTNKHF